MESKSDRFKRIVEKRTNNALNAIRLIGNCSNSNNYEYGDEQVRKIFATIETELKIAKAQYKQSKKHNEDFSL